MSPHELNALKAALPTMGKDEKLRVLDLLDEYEKRKEAEKARGSLLTFVKRINPAYKIGPHHKILAAKLEKAARGELDRLATAIAPRFGKSLLLSLYFPAWFMGNFPEQKLIISSHTADLAVDFGKKVRNLIDTAEYKQIFPDVSLATDSKSAGRWNTNKGGEFFAVGVGGAVAGRGADLCVHPDTLVITNRGLKKAKEVVVGDAVLGSDGFGKVLHKLHSWHEATVHIGNLRLSETHPVWTANRGWTEAGKILPDDLLQRIPFWVKVQLFFNSLWDSHGHQYSSPGAQERNPRSIVRTNIQHLGDDAPAMHQPKSSKLRGLWGTRYQGRSSLGQVCEFLRGYGRSAFGYIYSGPHRHEWRLHEVELSLGKFGDSTKQQAQQRASDWIRKNAVYEAVEPRTWDTVRYHSASRTNDGVEYRRGSGDAKGKSQSAASGLLYKARAYAYRLLGVTRSYGEGYRYRPTHNSRMFSGAQQIFLRVFLGIRRAGNVRTVAHEPRDFVNFHVEGHNTFFGDSFLTHNCIIDDPFSEQDILNGNYEVFDKVYEWYAYGMRTRLMPGGRVVTLHTRWAKNDLIGRILDEATKNPEADQWEYIEFPAILNEHTDNEKSLWPEQWSLESLKRTRATMPTFQWQAQYQQSPTSQQGAIIKTEWWQRWKADEPPDCEYVIMTLDAAQEVNKRADFTALATWGIFYKEMDDGLRRANIILLNCINKRIEFPQLKELALREYKSWQPDAFIIEKKSNGAALAQELRRMGIPLQDFTPARGTGGVSNNKFARLNAVADIVRSGLVWAPEYKWADDMIEQCNDFPAGKHDDMVDNLIMGLMRFRSGGFITLPTDEDYDDIGFRPRKRAAYY